MKSNLYAILFRICSYCILFPLVILVIKVLIINHQYRPYSWRNIPCIDLIWHENVNPSFKEDSKNLIIFLFYQYEYSLFNNILSLTESSSIIFSNSINFFFKGKFIYYFIKSITVIQFGSSFT